MYIVVSAVKASSVGKNLRAICFGYHMRGEVISVLSLEGRYHILSRVSTCSERGTNYDIVTTNESNKTDITESRMR